MKNKIPKKVKKRFNKWWEKHGQFMRAGGGQYEITFAYEAWIAAFKKYSKKKYDCHNIK